jgi:hypothetical protein
MLNRFPRPSKDSGVGYHDCAIADRNPGDYPDGFFDEQYRYGVRWFKHLTRGQAKLTNVQKCRALGVESIVRFYEYEPNPGYIVNIDDVRAFVAAGCNYFETNNEPNLLLEWKGGQFADLRVLPDGSQIDMVIEHTCQNFMDNTEIVNKAGGIHLFPALSPGGNYEHFSFYKSVIAWFAMNSERRRWFIKKAEGAKIAFAIHNRPINHPITYPFDTVNYIEKIASWNEKVARKEAANIEEAALDADGTTSFMMYVWLDKIIRNAFGFSLPLLGTEGGYELEWARDSRYPAVDENVHAVGNIEIISRLDPIHRDAFTAPLFCVCFWLYEGFGHDQFKAACWRNNETVGGGARDLLAWECLKNFRVDWNRRTQINYKETKMPNPEDELIKRSPIGFAEWQKAGGVRDNLLEFLVGAEIIPPTEDMLDVFLGNARASLAAAKKVRDAFPFVKPSI